MEGMGMLWGFATILGPIVIAVVLIYALVRRRRLSAAERLRQKEGTERAYKEPEKFG
jgi:hypothetical protein